MDEKALSKKLRKGMDKVGYALLLYYGIMNAAVMGVMILQMVFEFMMVWMQGGDLLLEQEAIIQKVISNGWGYVLAIAVGSIAMLLWKKPDFCFRVIWKPNRKMKFGSFLAILCIFLSGQLVFQVLAILMELLFNCIGMSVMDSVEAASNLGDTFSMFLYGCLLAPIFEEILFRGLLLRMMEPYGKKFSILATALLFGIFHGNIVQSPFAFAVGLVLGYVAIEYSMGWAMVLHMINNLVLSDMLHRVLLPFPGWVEQVAYFGIIGFCTLVAFVICIVKVKAIYRYLCERKIHPLSVKAFFTSPGILIFICFMLGNIALTLLMQLFSM